MNRKTKSEISHNAKIKHYPDGTSSVLVCSRPIFKEPGWEDAAKEKQLPSLNASEREKRERVTDPENVQRAARRAAAQMRDLVMSNEDLGHFVTLTLDASKIERYDMSAIIKRLNSWTDNAVRRQGLKYILVPERHKDGAIHFHGFFNSALELVDSGTYTVPGIKQPRKPRSEKQRLEWESKGAQKVYNVPGWGFGFSTAIALYGERQRAISYAIKYIRKQTESGKIGGRWYYSGGALVKPTIELDDVDIRDFDALEAAYSFEVAGLAFVGVNNVQ